MAYSAECDGCGRSGTVVTRWGEYIDSGRQLTRHVGNKHYCYSRGILGTCTYTRWKDAESAASDVGPDVPTANDADLEHVVTEHGGIPGLLEVEHPECRDGDADG